MSVVDLLPDYLMGGLAEAERAEVAAAVAASPELQAEVAALSEALFALADDLPEVAPDPAVRARLLASAAQDRLLPFADDLARICDLARGVMQAILRKVDDLAAWAPGPMPGIEVIHFDHGPGCLAADTGLVRFVPGAVIPRHRHLGHELSYVLEGTLIDDDGRRYGPGEVLDKTVDDTHGFSAGAEAPLVLVLVHSGFEFF